MDQIGLVIKKVDDTKVKLEVKRSSGWGSCNSCASSCEVKPHYVTINNNINAEPGDFVELQAVHKNIMKYVTIIYMIPFAFLILGIVIGNTIFKDMGTANHEFFIFGTGILFLAISFIVVRLIDKSFAKKDENIIIMTRKL